MSSAAIEDRRRASSDYGSDLDVDGEEQLCRLLEDIEVQHRAQSLVLEGLDEDANRACRFAVVPAASQSSNYATGGAKTSNEDEAWAVELDNKSFCLDLVAAVSDQAAIESPQRNDRKQSVQPAFDDIPDSRTPLERFRAKKPLSVTDLVSPAWCELQYWYTLTKFGRKKRTPAMKQGTAVHKKLEAQVHDFVPIDVQTREDMWGLRIWNIIQGLRTLRATGMTRELELWAVINGQVVNGIIDELSYTCTDPEMEGKLSETIQKHAKQQQEDPTQSKLSQFFESTNGARPSASLEEIKTIYLTDVKTRGSNTIPAGASLRPTLMQLMVYRKMLSELASNSVDSEAVFSRYNLNPDVPFSDALIAQLGSLDLNFTADAIVATHGPNEPSFDILTEIVMHNSLRQIWGLMIQQFQITIPHGGDSISRILRAEFRSAKDGSVICIKTFLHDEDKVKQYLIDEISWWRGEREARGVDVEEAFKCRICEFAEGCTWRNTKVEEAMQNSRNRATATK